MNDKLYHVTISSSVEVICRRREDYIRAINDLAVTTLMSDDKLLAFSVMSTHIHLCLQSSNPAVFVKRFKYSYTRYFNYLYKRKGTLFDDKPKYFPVEGINHCLTVISYVLRNPLHHGVCATSYEYMFSSVNAYFRQQFGMIALPHLNGNCAKQLRPANVKIQEFLLFGEDGLADLSSFVDFRQVEMMFQTPQVFALYVLVKRSGKKWREEQMNDENQKEAITLDMLESDKFLLAEMEKNERYKFSVTEIQDEAVCTIVDNQLIGKYGASSVYELDLDQKVSIGKFLRNKYRCSDAQSARCLAVKTDAYYRLLNTSYHAAK